MEEVAQVFAKLQETFRSGKTQNLEWRRGQLLALQRGIKESHDAIAKAVFADLHRPEFETLQAEVLSPLAEVKFALDNFETWAKPELVPNAPMSPPGTECIHYYKPKGLALIISPFNFPFNLTLMPLVGAIAAGDCVLIKPSEMAPHCAQVMENLVLKYLDGDAIKLMQGGVEKTTALLALPFDHFFYTGNGTVGRIVMQAAAKHLSTVTLELGGKSPVYVHSDANLPVCARRLVNSKFLNAGQLCVTADYVLVHESVQSAFVEQVKLAIAQFFPQPEEQMARVISDRHFHRVNALIQEARDKAIAVVGGSSAAALKKNSGRFIPPTLVINPSLDSGLMRGEIFGPVLPILTVPAATASMGGEQNLQACLEMIHRVDAKPLAAYIFTESDAVANEFLSKVQSGSACVNVLLAQLNNPNLAFGGSGPSGIGSYRGKHSFLDFSQRQAVVKQTTKSEQVKLYPPYHPKMAQGLKSML